MWEGILGIDEWITEKLCPIPDSSTASPTEESRASRHARASQERMYWWSIRGFAVHQLSPLRPPTTPQRLSQRNSDTDASFLRSSVSESERSTSTLPTSPKSPTPTPDRTSDDSRLMDTSSSSPMSSTLDRESSPTRRPRPRDVTPDRERERERPRLECRRRPSGCDDSVSCDACSESTERTVKSPNTCQFFSAISIRLLV